MSTRPGPVAGPPSRPDATLQSAAAMVFVADPAAPLLAPDDAHHLLDVLRLRPGELVVACDGSGSWSQCRIAPVPRGRASRRVDPAGVVTVDGPVVGQPRAAPEITVAFAPAKGDRPEWVVQKLTELGVDRIVPIHAARSVVRWDGERGERAVARLTRVAREAAAQARRTWLPESCPGHDPGPAGLVRPGLEAGPARGSRAHLGPGGGGRGPRGGMGSGRIGPLVRECGPRSHRASDRDRRRGRGDPPVRPSQRPDRSPCVTTLREGNYSGRQGLRVEEENRRDPLVGPLVRRQTCTCVTLAEPELGGRSVERSGGADVGD